MAALEWLLRVDEEADEEQEDVLWGIISESPVHELP